ncbi:MAG: VanZ family protein [Verrucomicrobia bacterium]|nr:VanZ family protein [Verrucomicrobiota bacterium]
MKWNILVELERRKHSRGQVRNTAARGLVLVSVMLVLYLGFAESVGSSERWQQVDKVMHFSLFGVFTFMYLQYARFKVFPNMETWKRLSLNFSGLLLLGFLAEISHWFIPTRTFEWWDMAANCAGILVVGIPAVCITPFRQRQNQLAHFDQARAFRDASGAGLKLRQYARSNGRRH